MFKEKIVFNKTTNVNSEKRELVCIITFDCLENATDFSYYVNKKNTKWETCSELVNEEDNTLTLYIRYSHGEMEERKEEIREMLEDFNS